MAPTTEIALLPFKAGVDVNDPNTPSGTVWQECATTILGQPGAQRLYFGHEKENPTNFWLFVDWDSYDAHQTFVKSREYPPFMKSLGSLMDSGAQMHHVSFDPHPPSAGLANPVNPVTEILHMYFDKDISEADQNKVMEGLKKFPVKNTPSIGWTMDEATTDKVEGGKAKALVGLIPWQSVDEHHQYRETPEFKENIHLIREAPGIKGLAVAHVEATIVQGDGAAGGGLGVDERGAADTAALAQEEVLNPQGAGNSGAPKTHTDGSTTKHNDNLKGVENAQHKERQGR